jgi:hypothetical protein
MYCVPDGPNGDYTVINCSLFRVVPKELPAMKNRLLNIKILRVTRVLELSSCILRS